MTGKAQRVVIVMIDGFGVDYLEQSPMPVLKSLVAKGVLEDGPRLMPAVTNVNNASICCGTWPEERGITGNSYSETELEELPPTFRTHGSLHETTIPPVIYNASGSLPAAERIQYNFDLSRTLFRDPN
jgi:predicted AlkP superfamily pyrophosphatase or phosphodiesterase